MPDHGARTPPRSWKDMGVSVLGVQPYGWAGTPPYNDKDVPSGSLPATDFAYERLDWSKFAQQAKDLGKSTEQLSNPPFAGAGQEISPLKDNFGDPSWAKKGGVSRRILRGYIRRFQVDPNKPETFIRVYFMYNPTEILRSYTSIMGNNAIDTTGSLGVDSANMPIAAFQAAVVTFELFFDRGVECATIPDFPGVLTDLAFFDGLVHNTSVGTMSTESSDLTSPARGSTTPKPPDVANVDKNYSIDWATAQSLIIDNTILVDVVFSPYLSFRGTIMGAEALFEKFNHRMTPTRMTLTITMNLYWVTKDTNQSLVPPDLSQNTIYNPGAYDPNAAVHTQPGADSANTALRSNAAAWALSWVGKAQYDRSRRGQGPPCTTATPFFDCSSLVNRAYRAVGWDTQLFLNGVCGGGGPSTGQIINIANQHRDVWDVKPLNRSVPANNASIFQGLQIGDLIIHGPNGGPDGHVVMFLGFTEFGPSGGPPDGATIMNKKVIRIVQAANQSTDLNATNKSGSGLISDGHTHVLRPMPVKVTSNPTGPR